MPLWSQLYDPLNNVWLSTLIAALPVLVMLGALGVFHIKAHYAALMGLAVALAGAVIGFGMPVDMAGKTALFGSLQRTSAQQLGLSPVLMAAANSSGGVMGKMIDAQSIVVAAVATKWHGKEGVILRYVFKHSLALAALVGILVMLQAYVWPFTLLVIHSTN